MKKNEVVGKPRTSNDKQVEDKVRDGKRKEKTVRLWGWTIWLYCESEYYYWCGGRHDDEDESEDTNVEEDKNDVGETDTMFGVSLLFIFSQM